MIFYLFVGQGHHKILNRAATRRPITEIGASFFSVGHKSANKAKVSQPEASKRVKNIKKKKKCKIKRVARSDYPETERVRSENYSILFGFEKKWVKWMGVVEWVL